MVVADRRGYVLLLAGIGWLPFAVGVPLLFRALTRDPGAGLLPDTAAIVVGVVGVVIGTVGFVWTVRHLDGMAVSGTHRGRRIVVPLGRVPEEYRGRAPSRPQVLRMLVAALTWLFGLLLSLGVVQDRAWSERVTFVVLVAVLCLVPAGIVAARLRRGGRRHGTSAS